MLYDFVNTMTQMIVKAITTMLIMKALNAMAGGIPGTIGQSLNAMFAPSSAFNPSGAVLGGNIGAFSEGSGGSISEASIAPTNKVINYNIYNPLVRNNWRTLDLVRQSEIEREDIS